MFKKTIILFIFTLVYSFNLIGIEMDFEDPKEISETRESDYLYAGKSLDLSGQVEDLYFFGEDLSFTGKTTAGLTAFGQNIFINGAVMNNLISAGERVDINGTVESTTFTAGENVTVSKEAEIKGSMFAGAANLIIRGKINGDLYAGAGKLVIEGIIEGNVKVGAGEIHIAEQGQIKGNMLYYSDNELDQEDKQRITGQIEHRDKNFDEFNEKSIKKFFIGVFIVLKIIILISFLIGSLLLLLLPAMKSLEKERRTNSFWSYLLWGLIPFFIYPSVIILSFIGIITIPLAFVLLVTAIPVLFITKLIGVTLLGKYLFKLFKWHSKNRFLYFLSGGLIYLILSIIPFIDFLATVCLSSVGWGVIIEQLLKKKLVNGEPEDEGTTPNEDIKSITG